MVSAWACLQSAPVTHPCLSHSPSSKNEKKKPWPYLGLSGALFLFALFQTPIHSNYPHIARMYRFVRCPACSLPIADLYSFAEFFVILDHNVAPLWSCAIEMFSFVACAKSVWSCHWLLHWLGEQCLRLSWKQLLSSCSSCIRLLFFYRGAKFSRAKKFLAHPMFFAFSKMCIRPSTAYTIGVYVHCHTSFTTRISSSKT